MYQFPQHLTKTVSDRWETLVAGEYEPPSLPPISLLKRLLEVCYLVSLETDEARPLKFTVCCIPTAYPITQQFSGAPVEALRFNHDRDFNVGEIRRLAATTDVDSSAIWITYSPSRKGVLQTHGLINQGPSWATARRSFTYWYESPPNALIVRVLGPGRLSVYQGVYLVAALSSGRVQESRAVSTLEFLGISKFLKHGIDKLSTMIDGAEQYLPTLEPPEYEPPKERYEFEYIAYLNSILSVINIIQSKGHGGALILTQDSIDFSKQDQLKIKYQFASMNDLLQRRFIEFIQFRNRGANLRWRYVSGPEEDPESDSVSERADTLAADLKTEEKFQSLMEAATFVGNLSGADGAIVITDTLRLIGFSAEIVAGQHTSSKIYSVTNPLQDKRRRLDLEQFGMRHRSAIKLCSNNPDLIVFVISQDGDVSLVWRKGADVMVRRGVNITNANMPLA